MWYRLEHVASTGSVHLHPPLSGQPASLLGVRRESIIGHSCQHCSSFCCHTLIPPPPTTTSAMKHQLIYSDASAVSLPVSFVSRRAKSPSELEAWLSIDGPTLKPQDGWCLITLEADTTAKRCSRLVQYDTQHREVRQDAIYSHHAMFKLRSSSSFFIAGIVFRVELGTCTSHA